MALLFLLIQDGPPLNVTFRDASYETVLQYFSRMTGAAFVVEAKLTGTVTAVCNAVPRARALDFLNSILRLAGASAQPSDSKIVKIVPEIPVVWTGSDPDLVENSDRLITQVVPLRRLRAIDSALLPKGVQVQREPTGNLLILTGRSCEIRRFLILLRCLDTPQPAGFRHITLKHARARETAEYVNALFKPADRRELRLPFGRQPPDPEPAEPIRAIADVRTNSIVVVAPEARIDSIEALVAAFDHREERTYRIIPMSGADVVMPMLKLMFESIDFAADAKGDALLVRGPAEDVAAMELIARQLDEWRRETLFIYRPKSGDPVQMMKSFQDFLQGGKLPAPKPAPTPLELKSSQPRARLP